MGTETALIIGAAAWLALVIALVLIWHRYVIRGERGTARLLDELDELDRRDRLGLVTPADDELAERRELRRYGRNR